ncbi:hypothetical protein IHV25_04925 [Phaeovibrio sulfidiphilus]|uniref:Uncharacterized protein n=1 Tax=Phaeovibrio sulfidiphilus TaxID=1220600 RepID=A0A8J6YWJ6_9PROT|nr:hypothetical protein [Phaeovibrio sulfidiphilus]MBE1236987.1 hypothetical protein [Phaeovibrio sulfidiphilus]
MAPDSDDDELDPCVLQRALGLLSERGYGPARNRGTAAASLILDGVTLDSLVELGESRGATGIRRRLRRGVPVSDIPAYPFLIVFKDRSAALVEGITGGPDGSAATFLIREERDDGTTADGPLSMDWDDLEAVWEGDALFYL